MSNRIRHLRRKAGSAGAYLVGCTFCLVAQAQVPPAVFDNLRAPVFIVPPSSNLEVENDTAPRKLITPAAGEVPKFAITGFRLVGFSAPLKTDFGLLLARFTGQQRNFDDLEAAAEAVQIAIRQEGLFLAQVDIPPQKLEDGVVELRVLEGRLDKWELAPLPDGLLVGRAQIEAVLGYLRAGDVLKVDEVERVLFLLSDLRGIAVKSVIEAGSKPGTAKLLVTVEPGQRFEKNADFDNFGSIYTGEYRLSGSVTVNSPFGRGDLFKLSGNATTNGGLYFVRGAYQTPVGGSGLKLGAAVSALQYRLGTPTFEPLQARGEASVYSLFALYPAIRTRNLNTFVQANYDRRNFRDEQRTLFVDNKKHSDVLSLGLVGDSRDQWLAGGINNFSTTLTTGRISLDNAQQLVNDQAITGRNINGNFGKLSYGLGRQQLLWTKDGNAQDRLVLFASLQGQRGSKNLDTSEKFSLGGATGVRGYANGEGTGDDGDLLSWELRKNILGDSIQADLVLSVFGDYGRVTVNRRPLPTDLINKISLVSHGVGLSWAMPDKFLFKLSLARRGNYSPVADPDPRRVRLYLSLSKTL